MGDPGEINRRSSRLRGLSIALVSVLVFGSLWATVLLISDLIQGGPETNSAGNYEDSLFSNRAFFGWHVLDFEVNGMIGEPQLAVVCSG